MKSPHHRFCKLTRTTGTSSGAGAGDDVGNGRKAIRGMRLLDIKRLIEASTYQEDYLKSTSTRYWLIHTSMYAPTPSYFTSDRNGLIPLSALACHFTLWTSYVRRLLGASQFSGSRPRSYRNLVIDALPWLAWTVSFYRVRMRERDIVPTEKIRDGARHLFDQVWNGRALRDDDITCFAGPEWDSVPLALMEYDLGSLKGSLTLFRCVDDLMVCARNVLQ